MTTHLSNAEVAHNATIARWYKDAEHGRYGSPTYKARCCLQAAEDNAACTEAYASADYWHVAYNSISFTNDFIYDKRVRNWFARRGYAW